MSRRHFIVGLFLALLINLGAADTSYLFTYFTRNGQDGLHLACSEDGLKWDALNGARSYLTPRIGSKEKLMRDPCVVRGPDGTYHMVWTSGWWEKGIGYASTMDFIHWSEQRELPVMRDEPTARNCWAPEIVYDETRAEFVIFWSTTIPGRFATSEGASEDELNHQIYCTTTKDFQIFTPTTLFFDAGFSCIDATFLRADGKQWLIVKDETKSPEPKKHLRLASAESVHGPFGPLAAPFTPDKLWVEGPTAIKIGDFFYVYFDAYTTKQYGAMRSRDLKNWETVSAGLHFPNEGTPDRMRHGTVIEVPRSLVDSLRRAATTVEAKH